MVRSSEIGVPWLPGTLAVAETVLRVRDGQSFPQLCRKAALLSSASRAWSWIFPPSPDALAAEERH